MTDGLLIGLLLPFAGTTAGAACVFLLRKSMPTIVQKALLGFASGVMVAASVWSLLIPSIELCSDEGTKAVIPATIGFLAGMGFLLLLDHITPHLHLDSKKPEGPHSKLSRTSMLTLAVTLHNLPEGMAVGAVMAGVLTQTADLSLAGAVALSIGIAIQNIPEGAIISMPMLAEGNSKWKSFVIGSLSGIVEPIGAIITLLLAAYVLGRSHALCRCRRTYSRKCHRKTQQYWNHRICHRICSDDDSRCRSGLRMVRFSIKKASCTIIQEAFLNKNTYL